MKEKTIKKLNPKTKETIGVIGQYGSGVLLAAGIVAEIIYAAHIGFILITTGGLCWGIFTKIRGK